MFLYNPQAQRVELYEDMAISAKWRGKANSDYPDIPPDIKAAYFDKTDGNVYFFDSSLVSFVCVGVYVGVCMWVGGCGCVCVCVCSCIFYYSNSKQSEITRQ